MVEETEENVEEKLRKRRENTAGRWERKMQVLKTSRDIPGALHSRPLAPAFSSTVG